MAVSCQTKTSTSTWTSVFPTETVTNVQESLKFMKKLTAVGVSTILYLRTNLPDDTFTVKNVDGMRVSIMTPNHRVTRGMCTAVTNGMKALKDGHLRELHVLFHPHKDTDELIEMHKFSFNLPKDRAPMETGDDKISNQAINDLVKKSTMKLLRILSGNLQSFGHLPDDAAMSIRLIYDDDAPEDYNPPGFISCSPEELENNFNGGKPSEFRMGAISTAWHKVEVDAMTMVDHNNEAQTQGNKSTAIDEEPSEVEKIVEDIPKPETIVHPETENMATMSTFIDLSGLDISQSQKESGIGHCSSPAFETACNELTASLMNKDSKKSGPTRRGRGGATRGGRSRSRGRPYTVGRKIR